MKSFSFLAVLSILAITLSLSKASDPSSLQDFCVGVNTPADGGMYMFTPILHNHLNVIGS